MYAFTGPWRVTASLPGASYELQHVHHPTRHDKKHASDLSLYPVELIPFQPQRRRTLPHHGRRPFIRRTNYTMNLPLHLQPTPHPPFHPSACSSRVFSVLPTGYFSSLTRSGIQTPMNGAWYELHFRIVHHYLPHVSRAGGLLLSSTHSITMMCDSMHPISVTK